ncbi:hypothetical protein E4U21_000586 [Claviceps maximensis]|nr:hypothetical protein E4U21_000586 [Claviceps maximensis]
MKFLSVFTFLTAVTGVFSHALEKRFTPVRKVIIDLGEGVGQIYEVARLFDGEIEPLMRASDRLVEMMIRAQRTAETCEPIGLSEALNLATPIKTLSSKSRSLVKILKMRSGDIRDSRACGVTRERVGAIMALGTKLFDTIINKMVSPLARVAGKTISKEMRKQFALAKETLSEANCPI